ncbi:MAG: hypothetical protein LZF86_20024 [Nitrospira sp.]|nr:MAG: hypothetical protein LZF86_20024 [Nitrospira sp.]
MRKKSENRSSIINPLHFGHSIESSQVVFVNSYMSTKQKLHQIVVCQYFNGLSVTYLSPGGKTYPHDSCKKVHGVRFLFREGES